MEFRIVDPVLPEPRKFLKYYEMSQAKRHYSNGGPCVTLLEERFHKVLNCHVVTCNNATSGLTAVLSTLKYMTQATSAGMSDFTYAATACAIDGAGLEIVSYDINEEYALNLGTYVNRAPKITVITCPFGSIPFKTIQECRNHDTKIVVDAAATLGLPWKDIKRLIGMVDAVVFSLHATKTFGIGEGGLVATKDTSLAESIQDALSFNLKRRKIGHTTAGMNGKMPELSAAVALAKLDSFESDNNRRIEKALDYVVDVMVEGMELYPFEHTYQVIPFSVESNSKLEKALNLYRIPFRKYYDAPLGRFEHVQSMLAHEHNICLPFSELMTKEHVKEIKRVLQIFEYMQERDEQNSLYSH